LEPRTIFDDIIGMKIFFTTEKRFDDSAPNGQYGFVEDGKSFNIRTILFEEAPEFGGLSDAEFAVLYSELVTKGGVSEEQFKLYMKNLSIQEYMLETEDVYEEKSGGKKKVKLTMHQTGTN